MCVCVFLFTICLHSLPSHCHFKRLAIRITIMKPQFPDFYFYFLNQANICKKKKKIFLWYSKLNEYAQIVILHSESKIFHSKIYFFDKVIDLWIVLWIWSFRRIIALWAFHDIIQSQLNTCLRYTMKQQCNCAKDTNISSHPGHGPSSSS